MVYWDCNEGSGADLLHTSGLVPSGLDGYMYMDGQKSDVTEKHLRYWTRGCSGLPLTLQSS